MTKKIACQQITVLITYEVLQAIYLTGGANEKNFFCSLKILLYTSESITEVALHVLAPLKGFKTCIRRTAVHNSF